MIAIVTLLCAFPLGYFLRSHLAANTAYAIAYLWAFTFQAVYLMPEFLEDKVVVEHGDKVAAADVPLADFLNWDYGLVTLGIFVAGFGLVALGRWTRLRRSAGAQGAPGTARSAIT